MLFDPHLIPALIGLFGFVAVKPVASINSVPSSASFVINPVYRSRGNNKITTIKLKKSGTKINVGIKNFIDWYIEHYDK